MGQCLSPLSPSSSSANGGTVSRKKSDSWANVPHSPLSSSEILSRIQQEASSITVKGRTFNYGSICFRGYYPDTPYKANQDDYAILKPEGFGGDDLAMFGVFDGHGHVGEKCARFITANLPTELVEGKANLLGDDEKIKAQLSKTFTSVNLRLHQTHDIDDTLSGSTAVVALFVGDVIWVANVGDSRCILVQDKGGGNLVTKALSMDQTPYRRDERVRVRKFGARVMNMDQLEGLEPVHDNWDMTLGDEVDEAGDPPRIWAPDGAYPGTAFSRSIGDSIAEELGVTADPEITRHESDPSDQLLIIASDGIWEFLTNKQVISIAKKADDPQEAACLLWKAAYKEWITKEVRTDDITVIVVDLGGYFASSAPPALAENDTANEKTPSSNEKKQKTRRGSTKFEVKPGVTEESA